MGVALRDIIADYKTNVAWEALSGTAAIDAHNALYQFLSIIRQSDGTPLMDREGRVTSHLSGLFFRMTNFIEKGIRPVFIFDGEPPSFKSETIEHRREIRRVAGERWEEALKRGDTEEAFKQARSASIVDKSVIETAKRLLALMGIPCVDAPSEGEAQAAVMVANGDVTYAVTQDYDALLFGTPTLVRNLTVSGKRKFRSRTITVKPERILLHDILSGLEITREELVEIGILIGTDFNEGIRGVGAKTALKIVRQGKFTATIGEKAPDLDPGPIKEFFLEPPATHEYMIEWSPPDADGIVGMLCDEFDFSGDRVKATLDRLQVKSGQKTLEQWF